MSAVPQGILVTTLTECTYVVFTTNRSYFCIKTLI